MRIFCRAVNPLRLSRRMTTLDEPLYKLVFIFESKKILELESKNVDRLHTQCDMKNSANRNKELITYLLRSSLYQKAGLMWR